MSIAKYLEDNPLAVAVDPNAYTMAEPSVADYSQWERAQRAQQDGGTPDYYAPVQAVVRDARGNKAFPDRKAFDALPAKQGLALATAASAFLAEYFGEIEKKEKG